MSHRKSASDLAKEASRLWEAGHLAEAERKYRESLSQIPEGHWAVPHVRGQLAGVLAQSGRNEEARSEFEKTLSEELTLASGRNDAGVRAIRYFLARHLLAMHDPSAALESISAVLASSPNWVMKQLEAEIHVALGSREAAVRALREALPLAQSREARYEIESKLAELTKGTSEGA